MSFLSLILAFGLSAQAQILPIYNAVRCRRPAQTSTAVHVAIINTHPDSMYWIENDRVSVLSNDVDESDSVITGIAFKNAGKYVLNYTTGDYKVLDATGAIVSEETLACEFCPANMDYCPGDAPGNGTNVPPTN